MKIGSIRRQVEREDWQEAEVENTEKPSNQINERNYRVQ